jgi:two-component system response regulator QseB
MRLLLVEDDRMIGESVQDVLRAEHFAVDWVQDGHLAWRAAQDQAYDLVLLDLGLPGKDGLDVLRDLRAARVQTPVLVATARDSVQQRIAGLNAGADDYVLKPYDLGELLARVHALLRRSTQLNEHVYVFNGVKVNPESREVTVDDRPVQLSAREWGVLLALLKRPGVLLSRTQLEDKVFGWQDDIVSNVVEVYIHGLRKKLGADLIVNVRGVGYMVPKP